MHICNGTYFTGTCIRVGPDEEPSSSLIETINSANCTCQRDCKCENIVLTFDEYGRAYLKGGCRTCNAEYIAFTETSAQRFFRTGVEALVIRSGCNLTIYNETLFGGIDVVITTEIFENIQGDFRSYKFTCNEADFVTGSLWPKKSSNSSLMTLPTTAKETIYLYSSSSDNHIGLKYALSSLASGRSWRNAYVLLIGIPRPEYCKINDTIPAESMIGECHLSVDLTHLGISDARIRFIFYSNKDHQSFPEADEYSIFLASLDEYFSNHEELQNAIPNAVIIRERLDTAQIEGSSFQRKLQMLSALRARVLDENFSNVVFVKKFPLVSANHSKVDNFRSYIASQENKVKETYFLPLEEQVFSETVARLKAVKMLGVKCEGTTEMLRKIINGPRP